MNPLDESVRIVLAGYSRAASKADCRVVTETAGFSGAVIVKVETDAATCALRRWPASGPPPRRLRGLHRLLGHLRDRGIAQLAVPIRSNDGDTLVEHRRCWWQLEPWKPGVADFQANPTIERLQAAMRVLADLHVAAAGFRPRLTEEDWFGSVAAGVSPSIHQRWQLLSRWTPDRLAELRHRIMSGVPSSNHCAPETREALRQAAARISTNASLLAADVGRELREATRLQVPLQPCLRDIWHDHLLYTGPEVTGVIDPAACRCETVAADLSRLLGSLVPDDRTAWQAALREYSLRRPLSVDEQRLIPVFDRSGVLLSGLTWLDRLWFRDERIPRLPRVADRLAMIAGRLERFTGGPG